MKSEKRNLADDNHCREIMRICIRYDASAYFSCQILVEIRNIEDFRVFFSMLKPTSVSEYVVGYGVLGKVVPSEITEDELWKMRGTFMVSSTEPIFNLYFEKTNFNRIEKKVKDAI
jgi:hypothetical protein